MIDLGEGQSRDGQTLENRDTTRESVAEKSSGFALSGAERGHTPYTRFTAERLSS